VEKLARCQPTVARLAAQADDASPRSARSAQLAALERLRRDGMLPSTPATLPSTASPPMRACRFWEALLPRAHVLEFTRERKSMSVFCEWGGGVKDAGLDSLESPELRNGLAKSMGMELPGTPVFDASLDRGNGGNGNSAGKTPSGPLVRRLLSLGQPSGALATAQGDVRGQSAGRQTGVEAEEEAAGSCLLVKGAPEELLARCVPLMHPGRTEIRHF
jgi:magnesium-transporting ATPase (P-type)